MLQLWGFRENIHRTSVMRDDVKWVYSDTLGLARFKSGQFMVADATQGWPDFTKLLTKWLKDRMPDDIGRFHCTSISVNKKYAGRLH